MFVIWDVIDAKMMWDNRNGGSMKITILAIGSRGDIEPYLALGAGLKAAGYQIKIATHANFRDEAIGRGLEFHPVTGNPRTILENEVGKQWIETGKRVNPFTFMKRMRDATASIMPGLFSDCLQACQGADLILTHILAALAANSIGEKLHIAVLPAYLQHIHPTRQYPSPSANPMPKLGGAYNQLTYRLSEIAYWQTMRPLINCWRVESLKLTPYTWGGPFGEWTRRRPHCLYGFSPHVIPRAPEWGDEIHITGYWFLDNLASWNPPADLRKFLESGDPPVFVGFGSMISRRPQAMTELVVKTLLRAGCRGLIGAGWGDLGQTNLPESIFRIESAPYEWLFPRMAAVVHHGGAGTTAAAFRAGVPSLAVPFFGDQFFWGWRISALGAGPKAIPRQKLTVERLSATIRRTLDNRQMRVRAATLGEQIRAEDGVGNAVRVVQKIVYPKSK